MTADKIVEFARVLMGEDGLRLDTEAHLRKLAADGECAKLGTAIGDGKSTARAIYLLATGRFNHDLPRHERRVIEHYYDGLVERQKRALVA